MDSLSGPPGPCSSRQPSPRRPRRAGTTSTPAEHPAGAPAPVDGWSGTKSGHLHATPRTPAANRVARWWRRWGTSRAALANTDSAKWEFAAPATTNVVGSDPVARRRCGTAGEASVRTTESGLLAPLDRNDPADAFAQCTAGIQCPSGVGNTTATARSRKSHCGAVQQTRPTPLRERRLHRSKPHSNAQPAKATPTAMQLWSTSTRRT